MSKKRRLAKEAEKKVAKVRVLEYFDLAKSAFSKDPKLSDKYVGLARRLAMRHRMRIPSDLKRSYCKHCYTYLVPARNCRVRINNGRVVYSCFSCRKFMRFELKKK